MPNAILANSLTRAWYLLRLRHELRERTGNAYQDFFWKLMKAAHGDDFVAVKPAGRQGDRKCDGLLVTERKLFQVYAPEAWRTEDAEEKVDEDFDGAVSAWDADFDEWVFVHNAHRGLPPGVASKLLAKNGTSQKRVSAWTESTLFDKLMSIPSERICDLLGPPFDPSVIVEIGNEDLMAVVESIEAGTSESTEVSPVPRNKRVFNGLSSDVEAFLTLGRVRAPAVGRFFATHPDGELGDRLAATLRTRYARFRSEGLEPDEIFLALLTAGGLPAQCEMRRYAAVIAVHAYFFDACDIFENPAAGAGS